MAGPDGAARGLAPARWSRRERVGLAVLLGAALALRVAHVLALRASPYFEHPVMDGAYHLEWARAVAAGNTFVEGPFFRAPLYPWWLAGALRLTGGSLLGARLLQAGLGVATTFLTWLLGRRLGGPRVGWIAGWLAALSWVLVYFDGEFLIETLSVPLNLAALLASLRLGDDLRPRRGILAGALWGLAALARPNVLLFLPVLAVWLLGARGRPWRARLVALLALGSGSALPILPITLTNRLHGGEWVLVSTQAGVNLWIGNNPESDGSSAIVPGTRGGWWEGYHDSIALAERESGRALGASEVSRHYSRKAWRWIASEPGAALRHLAWKLRLFLTNAELGNNLDVSFFARHFDPLLRLSPVRFDLLLGFGLLGLVLAARRGWSRVPVWSFVLVYSASVVAFFVCSRFRVPILPPLMACAALGLDWLVERVRARDVARASVGALAVLLVVLGSDRRPAEIRSSEANGRLLLGQAALESGDPRAALVEFEAALAADPDHPIALFGLGRAAKASGDLPRAERVLRQALAALDAQQRSSGRRPFGLPELRAELADVLVDDGRPAEALALSEPWIAGEPDQPALRYVRGRAHAALGRLPEACVELEQALAIDPRFLPAYDALAELYRHLGREQDAARLRARRAALGGSG